MCVQLVELTDLWAVEAVCLNLRTLDILRGP